MRTPKITAKRALGLTLAGALAVAGTVAVANVSQAATVQSLKLSSATGSADGGTVITVTGKDFQSAAGTSKIGAVSFNPGATACTTTPSATLATNVSVVSPTKLVITTPALTGTSLAGTAYNLCITTPSNAAVLGTAKFSSYPTPRINDTTGLSTKTGASYGGTQITITGENFSTKTTATVGGKALTGVKVVIGTGRTQTVDAGDDTLTGVVPAGTGASKVVTVTNEGGSYASNKVTALQVFSWLDSIKVAPAFGDGTDNNVITVTGTGFKDRAFVDTLAANKSAVLLTKAGTNLTTATTIATAAALPTCDKVQVVSDTELNCQLPALSAAAAAGTYTVQVVDADGTNVSAATSVARSATYTAAAF